MGHLGPKEEANGGDLSRVVSLMACFHMKKTGGNDSERE